MRKTRIEPIGWVEKTFAAAIVILLLAASWASIELLRPCVDDQIIIMMACVVGGLGLAYISHLSKVSKPIEWGLAGFGGMMLILLVFPITSRGIVGITLSLIPPSFKLTIECLTIGAISTVIAVVSISAGWFVLDRVKYACAGKWLLAGGVFHLAWGVSMFLGEAHRKDTLGLFLVAATVSLVFLVLLVWRVFQKR